MMLEWIPTKKQYKKAPTTQHNAHVWHIHPCKHTHALLSSPTLSLSCRHDSSRSPIKSHSPDVSFAHNSKESRRSRTKSRSPDSSSRHSKILEDLGRADIFGPLSGDPHDRPIATVGISLGNTHTNTHKQINTRLFVMGYEHGNFKKFISWMLPLEKQNILHAHATHTPKHIHGCVCVHTHWRCLRVQMCGCRTKLAGMVVCISSCASKHSWWLWTNPSVRRIAQHWLHRSCSQVSLRVHCDAVVVQDWNMIFHGWYSWPNKDMLLTFYLLDHFSCHLSQNDIRWNWETYAGLCCVCVCARARARARACVCDICVCACLCISSFSLIWSWLGRKESYRCRSRVHLVLLLC